MGIGIDEDGGFVSVLQGVCEIEAANAEISDTNFRGKAARGKATEDFDAESVITEENVSNTGDENACALNLAPRTGFSGRQGLDLIGIEEKPMARLSEQSQIPSGIIIEHDANMNLAFVVLLDAFDDGNLPGKCDVHDVTALSRSQANAI